MGFLTAIIPPQYKAIAIAVVAAAIFVVGFASGFKLESLRWGAAETKQAEVYAAQVAKTIAAERQAADISAKADADLAQAKAQVRTVTQTITKKVKVYVPAQADARCVIPRGFVQLHDAAAAGRALPDVPDPAASPDGGPSGVALSDVAGTIADNYGTYAEVVTQLRALQGWVRAQQAIGR